MWLAGGRGVAAVLRTRRAYPELRNGPAMSVWGSRHLPPFRAGPACSRPRREKNREAPRDLIQRHALAGARAGVGLDRPRSFRAYEAWRPQPGARRLEIFVHQTALMLERIASAGSARTALAAHTLRVGRATSALGRGGSGGTPRASRDQRRGRRDAGGDRRA